MCKWIQRRDKLTTPSTNRSSIAHWSLWRKIVTASRTNRPPSLRSFAADSHGLPSLRIYSLAACQSQFERDLVITSHRTPPSKICGSVRAIPFGRAGKRSSQPRGSSLGADKKHAEVPTHPWFNIQWTLVHENDASIATSCRQKRTACSAAS
jgi:hypothetical protein